MKTKLLVAPRLGGTMLVFKAQLMYLPKPVGGARGGGCLHHAHYAFPKRKALSVH